MATSITDLSSRIAKNTTIVNDYLVSKNLPGPSFGLDSPEHLLPADTPPEITSARQAVIYDCLELRNLLLGPREQIMTIGYQATALVSPKLIIQNRLAHAFPLDSSTTFPALATASGLGETHLRKVLRHAIAMHNIFAEPSPGIITHSAASRLLATDPALADWLDYTTHEHWNAAFHTPEAMTKFPGSGEPHHTGFSVAHNTGGKSFFGYMSDHPDRLRVFASVMRYITQRPELGPELVVDAYPWGDLASGATVVDVGGSHGLVSIELARQFPELRFIVQDLDEPVVKNADAKKPAEIGDRVTFMRHDFFEEQPVKGAEIYFLRAVLHNWSDGYAVKILRALIPALKKGAKIVVNDVVMAETGTGPKADELRTRISDLIQLVLNNAGNREMDEWVRLFATADPRFRFQGATRMPGSTRLWILVAEWEG